MNCIIHIREKGLVCGETIYRADRLNTMVNRVNRLTLQVLQKMHLYFGLILEDCVSNPFRLNRFGEDL